MGLLGRRIWAGAWSTHNARGCARSFEAGAMAALVRRCQRGTWTTAANLARFRRLQAKEGDEEESIHLGRRIWQDAGAACAAHRQDGSESGGRLRRASGSRRLQQRCSGAEDAGPWEHQSQWARSLERSTQGAGEHLPVRSKQGKTGAATGTWRRRGKRRRRRQVGSGRRRGLGDGGWS